MAKVRVGLAALAFLGWCGLAHALSLGDIQVHSHLNQVVAADIPVSVSNPGEADDLIVELASNEEFEQHGIERAEFLSTLRFSVDSGVIKVTSKQIAREPFLTFLLNVRWSGGRLLREYTILLDPPAVATASSGISKPQPASAEQAPAASAASAPPAGTPIAKAPAKAAAPAEAAEPAHAAAASSASSGGGTYGPVSPKETLWSIAYKLRPDPSLTMDQMQIAFVNANPKAFEGGKVNGLMKGSTLRVPTIEEIRAVDPASAKSQVAAARNAAPPVAVARAETPAPRHEAAPAVAPEPVPAPAPKAAPAPEPKPAPAPKVVEPPPQAVSPPPQPVVTPPPAQAPPTEVAQAPKAPAAESAAAPSQAPAPSATPPPATKPAPAPAPKAAPPAQPESDLLSTILDAVKGLADNTYVLYGIPAIIAIILLALGGRKVGAIIAKKRYELAARKAAQPQAAPSMGDEEVTQVAEAPSTEQMLQDAASEDTPTVVSTQAMAPVAATQAMGSDTMQRTMQQTGSQTQVVEPAQAASGKVDFDVTGTFADQTVQIKLDAGDPVSEAEFHRAYGLYDEAALLLKQALEKDPKRTDARVKLAEIYFEASKANEFIEVAKVLKGQLPEAEWQKIALLGSQIAPTHELFSGAAGGGGGSVDISFDEPAAPSAAPAAPAPAAPAADAGLDFKLEDVQLDVPAQAPAAAAPAAPAEGGLEFDLGSLSLDTPADAAASPAAPAAAPAADAGLDLGSFDLGAPDATQAATPAAGGGDIVEMGGDLSVGDVAGAGDESSTKLDLARAYIDMGDNDMAKSLLNEVSTQGNDQQKKEAQELLKRVPA